MLFMHNLEVFIKSEVGLNSLAQSVRIFSMCIKMGFGLSKSDTMVTRRESLFGQKAYVCEMMK